MKLFIFNLFYKIKEKGVYAGVGSTTTMCGEWRIISRCRHHRRSWSTTCQSSCEASTVAPPQRYQDSRVIIVAYVLHNMYHTLSNSLDVVQTPPQFDDVVVWWLLTSCVTPSSLSAPMGENVGLSRPRQPRCNNIYLWTPRHLKRRHRLAWDLSRLDMQCLLCF